MAILLWIGAVSTRESWVVNSCSTRCSGCISAMLQCKLVSGWGLRKPADWALWLRNDVAFCDLGFVMFVRLLLLIFVVSPIASNRLERFLHEMICYVSSGTWKPVTHSLTYTDGSHFVIEWGPRTLS